MTETIYPIRPVKITHVIFDVDGLMFDNEILYQRSFVEGVGPAFGFKMTEEDYLLMCGLNSHDIEKMYSKAYGRPEGEWSAASEMSQRWMLDEIKKNGIKVKPGLRELLKFLGDRRIPIALASGSSMHVILEGIKAAGLEQFFNESNIIDGDSVINGKPNPDIFLKAMKKIGCDDPGECLVFEDSVNGIHAAKNGGFPCIVVPDLVNSYKGNEDCCFKCLKTLDEAIPIIDGLIQHLEE